VIIAAGFASRSVPAGTHAAHEWLLALVVAFCAACAACTRVGTAALGTVRANARFDVLVAWVAALALVLAAAAIALWWSAIATGAPGFLGPVGPGASPGLTDWPSLALGEVAFAAGGVLAAIGAVRATRAARIATN
jgi:hypothetical protein